VILPSRGFFYYPSRDAAKRTERQSQTETSRQQTDYELLKKEDKQTVQAIWIKQNRDQGLDKYFQRKRIPSRCRIFGKYHTAPIYPCWNMVENRSDRTENDFSSGTYISGNRPQNKAHRLVLVRLCGAEILENDHSKKILKGKMETILEIETWHRRQFQHSNFSGWNLSVPTLLNVTKYFLSDNCLFDI